MNWRLRSKCSFLNGSCFTVTNSMFAPSLLRSLSYFQNCCSPLFSDVAEKYFQESMTSIKDSEGAERAKFLSIQDEFCSFLQTTGQKEVSEPRSRFSSYSHGMPKTSSLCQHLLCTNCIQGRPRLGETPVNKQRRHSGQRPGTFS